MKYLTSSHRLIDAVGKVPASNYGVSLAKNIFRDNLPYVFVGDHKFEYSINFGFHFISSLRRVLSGVTGDTRFSKTENSLYNDFIDWSSGDKNFTGEREVILEELDSWLVNEIQGLPHSQMTRNYALSTSVWNNYGKEKEVKGDGTIYPFN